MPQLSMIGLAGIIVAIAAFLYLVYKGYSPFWVTVCCSLLVVLTNLQPGIPIITQLAAPFSTVTDSHGVETVGPYLLGLWEMIKALFPMIFLGVILGKMYNDTGAAESIARTLTNTFVIKREGKAKVAAAILVLWFVSAACTLGGIDGYVLTFTLLPICLVMCEMVNIPRRFIPAMFCLNCAFMTAPGAPQIYNIITEAAMKSQIPTVAGAGAMQIVGQLAQVNSMSALIPGLAATLFITTAGVITLITMINNAMAKGEQFEYGPVEKVEVPDRTLPHFAVALLPLICVFLVFTVLKQPVFIALLSGILLAMATMGVNLPKYNFKNQTVNMLGRITGTLNSGAAGYPTALLTVATPNGLASVVTATAVFGAIVGMLAGLQINPILLTIIIVCVVVALTSAPPAALFIAMSIIVPVSMGSAIAAAAGNAAAASLQVSPHAIFRVGCIAASTFETLPVNGLIILGLGLARTSHKESYKPMFLMTVLYTFIGTIIAALLCMVPGLV